MFSSRLDWDLQPNRIAALVEAKRRAGAEILDLTESNPTRAGLAYPARELLSALADERSLVYEPAPAGLAEPRAAVSEYYRARGADVPAGRILLAASTSEAYAYLFKLLCDPGDEVLAPRPSYPLFEFLARLEAVRVIQYRLAYHGRWEIDLDFLEAAVTARTRAVVVVNPNNPTGSFLKRAELARLAKLGLPLISDEVFSDYALAEDAERVSTLAGIAGAPAFSLSGLSKIAGLPQMKLGWIAVAGPLEWRARALERLELIADTYLSVSTPIQHAAARLLAAGARVAEQISARTRGNLGWLRTAVSGSSADALEVEGGWYAILRVPRTRTEEEWTLELLDRDGVLVQPGFFYDFEGEAFLVVSLLTPEPVFREGIGRVLRECARA
jgi:alanine-synthesizing transaminase